MPHAVVVQREGLNTEGNTRSQTLSNIASWIGKQNDPEHLRLAGIAWDGAIKWYNMVPWRFNRIKDEFDLIADENEYPLQLDFRNPMSCNISDANGDPSAFLPYKPLEALEKDYPEAGSSSDRGDPSLYTVISPERDAKVYFLPVPGEGAAGKRIRFRYHCRIALATAADGRLFVPQSVEEGIYWKAVETFLAMKGAEAQKLQVAIKNATQMYVMVQFEYMDHPDRDMLYHKVFI